MLKKSGYHPCDADRHKCMGFNFDKRGKLGPDSITACIDSSQLDCTKMRLF